MTSEPRSPHTESLVEAFRRGDLEQFELLYERLAPALYAWAELRLPTTLEASDLIGEVWLRATRRVAEFDPTRSPFRAWVFGIAKNVLLQCLRQQYRDPAILGSRADSLCPELEEVPEAVTSLSSRIAREESLANFLGRVGLLDSQDRELVVFCGLEGLSCGEAATRLGLSREAALKRWQRLRAELRTTSWVEGLLVEES